MHAPFRTTKTLAFALSLCLAVLPLSGAESPQSPAFQLRLVRDNPSADTEEMTLRPSSKEGDAQAEKLLHVQKKPLLDETAVASASVEKDPVTGSLQILITFTEEGKELFADFTRRHVGEQLAIVAGDQVLSAPRIVEEIWGGKVRISGPFTEEEAAGIVNAIKPEGR